MSARNTAKRIRRSCPFWRRSLPSRPRPIRPLLWLPAPRENSFQFALMDNLEPQTASGQPEATGLQAQVESLTHLVHSLMVLLIVISGTINIYFWHQFQGKRTEVNMLNQYINE